MTGPVPTPPAQPTPPGDHDAALVLQACETPATMGDICRSMATRGREWTDARSILAVHNAVDAGTLNRVDGGPFPLYRRPDRKG